MAQLGGQEPEEGTSGSVGREYLQQAHPAGPHLRPKPKLRLKPVQKRHKAACLGCAHNCPVASLGGGHSSRQTDRSTSFPKRSSAGRKGTNLLLHKPATLPKPPFPYKLLPPWLTSLITHAQRPQISHYSSIPAENSQSVLLVFSEEGSKGCPEQLPPSAATARGSQTFPATRMCHRQGRDRQVKVLCVARSELEREVPRERRYENCWKKTAQPRDSGAWLGVAHPWAGSCSEAIFKHGISLFCFTGEREPCKQPFKTRTLLLPRVTPSTVPRTVCPLSAAASRLQSSP